jgi:selenide,water dikinase
MCFVLVLGSVPLYAGAREAAERGVRTGGDPRNRSHLEGRVAGDVPDALAALAYDPQTSGGLLAAVTPEQAVRLGADAFPVVGRVEAGPASVRLVGR